MSEDWSKKEKEIARRAFAAAYNRECTAILEDIRKMAAESNEPARIGEIHDYLDEKQKEMRNKYDYRYSVLLSVFARLIYDGWMNQDDLEGISEDKLQEIRRVVEFYLKL